MRRRVVWVVVYAHTGKVRSVFSDEVSANRYRAEHARQTGEPLDVQAWEVHR